MPRLLSPEAASTPAAVRSTGVPITVGLLAALARRSPAFSAAQALANTQHVAQALSGRSIKTWARVPGGEAFAPLQRAEGRTAFFCGDTDPDFTAAAREIVRPGDSVIDVGSGIGVAALLLASLVGSKGIVRAYESEPETCVCLLRTVRHNAMSQIAVTNAMIGSGAPVRGASIAQVPILRLDEIISLSQRAPIRLIRIASADAAEDVLRGAAALLAAQPPASMWTAVRAQRGEVAHQPLVSMLRSYGYDFYTASHSFTGTRLARVDYAKPLARHTKHLLALHRDVRNEPKLRSLG